MSVRRVRWECPNGEHAGVLGSTRPPLDSTVRYCLPCSESSGRLVKRTAPALERKRAARATTREERRRARAKREADRERDRCTVDGLDLREELKQLCRLRAFAVEGPVPSMAKQPPELHVRITGSMPRSECGVCFYPGDRIQITKWPGLTADAARETLLHELAHACTMRVDPSAPGHGDLWRSIYREAMREAYGITPDTRNRYFKGELAKGSA